MTTDHANPADARAREIAAALDEYDKLGEKSFYEISDHDNIRARQIQDNMGDWLRDLLAERERLLKVLEWYSDSKNYETPYNWKHDEYMQSAMELDDGDRARQALAALDADGSDRATGG